MALLDETQQNYYDTDGIAIGKGYGNYQFASLKDIINQFMLVYVGEDKIIPKAKRLDVAFHAQRALAELSFDTLRSCKSQEITVPPTLQMILPQDYVNYTKISFVDSAGIKHPLYPTKHTSNPHENPLQDSNGDFTLQAVGTLDDTSSDIVLDDEYKDIVVGMTVSGPYIPKGTIVRATSNLSSITTITIENSVGVLTTPTFNLTNATLTFGDFNGELIKPQVSSHIVENLSWASAAPYNKITASTAADIADIKVGMLVSHDHFPPGTEVINIDSNIIVVSKNLLDITVVNSTGEITFIEINKDTDTWSNYKSSTPSENQDDYQDDTYWRMDGNRYGLEPQHAQVNGSFYIDKLSGKIHFSSNISGKTVILDYISDSLGTENELQVHKFAEEAMYKWISYAILSGKANVPEYQVQRLKKERFAAIRTAKLRLSNLKLEELTQILRGKSKQIKH